ncbi:MAG: signal peptidase I [Dehalococcoidia bacterium]|nr:signal peptidase I [Dehalococcoidia bacterium]
MGRLSDITLADAHAHAHAHAPAPLADTGSEAQARRSVWDRLRGPTAMLIQAIDTFVTLLVIAVLLGVGGAALPNLWGWRSYIVMTGSMKPTISVGSVVVAEPVSLDQLRPEDIITFSRAEEPDVIITHRIYAVVTFAGSTQLTTKGDANDVPDSWYVGEDDRVERVVYHAPLIGHLIQFSSAPQVRALLMLGALLYMIAHLVKRWRGSG